MLGYLKQESVLAALGVPVNFTEASNVVALQFLNSHEYASAPFVYPAE